MLLLDEKSLSPVVKDTGSEFRAEVCGCRLVEIASYFGLKRIGSITTTIGKLKRLMSKDKELMSLVNQLRWGRVTTKNMILDPFVP